MNDPWNSAAGPWGNWKRTGSDSSSSSGPALSGQGGTSQTLWGAWHPEGGKATTAVGTAAGQYHQQQQQMASAYLVLCLLKFTFEVDRLSATCTALKKSGAMT
jgi:hypothetical protein